jgi:Flp pilus assembly protein TadG
MTTAMGTGGQDRGVVASEMAVVMVTFFAGFLLLVVYAGRVGQASNDVRSAAQEAARAASLQSNRTDAEQAARDTAASNLAASGVACSRGLVVSTELSQFRSGGQVGVTVECTASLADVTSLGLPGSRTYAASAVEVLDTYITEVDP